jgi:hypothetical protein
MENNKLINQWKNGLRVRHISHSRAFSYFKLRDRIIGLIATVLSAVVGTTVFASLAESDSNTLIIIAGCISILATLFAASHTFLKYSELAEKHHQAAASFGQLRRDLEIVLMDASVTSINDEKLQKVNDLWSELEKTVPAVPQKIYDASKDESLNR